jgi:hypothetical protein
MLLLARYAMQNGASFVDMVRTKQSGNAEYDFLNVPGSPSYAFFQWALFATGCGLPIDKPLPEGFVPPPPQPQPQQQPTPQQQPPQYAAPMQPLLSQQQQQMMYAQQPGYPGQPYMQPPPQHYPQQQQQQQQPPLRPTPPPIPPEVAGGFSQVLDALTGSKVRCGYNHMLLKQACLNLICNTRVTAECVKDYIWFGKCLWCV